MQHHLLEAYQGEIYGIAFFQHMLAQRPEEADLWQALLAVEIRTAALLAPEQAVKVSAPERAALLRKGINEARRWQALPQPQLLSTLCDWVAPYEVRYRQWAEQDSALKMVAEHETALYQSLCHARDGQPFHPPLQAFLTRYSL